jgi:AhpD family alkylhydroperoxidase
MSERLRSKKRTAVGSAKKRSAPAPSARNRHVPFPEEDNGAQKAPEQIGSYSMVDPRFREIYFQFYKETYRPSALDRKTKELVAIAASLAAKCQGCLDGHIKKALKFGATREEISETIAISMGVNAAAIVDLTDIAAENLEIKLF